MNRRCRQTRALAGLLLLTGIGAGCGTTQPARFFALQPLPEVSTASREHYSAGPLIGVGPVQIPKYLDRLQIAVTEKSPEIYYSEFNRWAAPLDENITQVLIGNLGALLSTSRIVRFPWIKNVPTEYWVVVRVEKFDGTPGGKAMLDMTWLIYAAEREKLKIVRSAYLEQPVADKTYEALVNAQSALLAEVSRRIAADIQAAARQSKEPAKDPPPEAPAAAKETRP